MNRDKKAQRDAMRAMERDIAEAKDEKGDREAAAAQAARDRREVLGGRDDA